MQHNESLVFLKNTTEKHNIPLNPIGESYC